MTMAILDAAVFSWIDLIDLITDLRADDWHFLFITSNGSTSACGQSPKLKAEKIEGKCCFGVLANRAFRTNSVVQFHGMRPQMVGT